MNEGYDPITKKYRKVYSLDSQGLCFLSFFSTDMRELEYICFDVEAADDYHYQINADQISKLCKYLLCENNEKDIITEFSKRIKMWKNPIEIADLCRSAEIKFQVHHWH